MLRVLFGFEGRIGRRNYWLAIILQVVIVAVVGMVAGTALVAAVMGGMVAADGAGVINPESFMGPDGKPSEGAVAAMIAAIGIPYLIFIFFICGFAIYMSLAAQIKRLHDMNMSGWLTLLNFVPLPVSASLVAANPANGPMALFLSLIPFGLGVACAFFPGTKGPNHYGEDRLSIFDLSASTKDETWADRAQAHRDSLREQQEERNAAEEPRERPRRTRSTGPITTRKGFGKRSHA